MQQSSVRPLWSKACRQGHPPALHPCTPSAASSASLPRPAKGAHLFSLEAQIQLALLVPL